MPRSRWTEKDERQYEKIKQQQLDDGSGEDRAEEIAARTVNKRRREEGRTRNPTSQGTGNPQSRLEDRSVRELYNIAKDREIAGRSKMTKAELIRALRQ